MIELPSKMPVLSLILCSRNDRYMGNSRWRLQTTLNYAAKMIHEIGRQADVEIIVSDWGSDIPLREVLELSPAAAEMVSFIQVPARLTAELQKDSPFSDALALNTAARRANGEYIGRIDQDTLVGRHFLEYFFELYEGKQQLPVPLAEAQLFSNLRMVPYRFCVRCPSIWNLENYIDWFGRSFKIEVTTLRPFYAHGVGIWLLHRNLWDECGGYDERMIYMNDTEVNMITRLGINGHEIINLGKLVDYDFYHMEHYHPLALRSSSTHRKVNPELPFSKPEKVNPNGSGWGFVEYSFPRLPYSSDKVYFETTAFSERPFGWPKFLLRLATTGSQICLDMLAKTIRHFYLVWRQRIRIVMGTIRGKPLVRWPQLVSNLLVRKQHDQK